MNNNYTITSIGLDLANLFYNFAQATKCIKSGDLSSAFCYVDSALRDIHGASVSQCRANLEDSDTVDWEGLANVALKKAQKDIEKDNQ